MVQRRVQRRRHAGPDTLLLVRGDRHVASPEVRPGIDEQPARSAVTGGTSPAGLQALAHEVVEPATRVEASRGAQGTRGPSTRDQAGTGARSRRGVLQVEVAAPGVNPRFVVTDLEPARTPGVSPPRSWARGHRENESHDPTRSLQADRTSWHRVAAHQGRVRGHSAAAVWLETCRREVCKPTQWASATRETIP